MEKYHKYLQESLILHNELLLQNNVSLGDLSTLYIGGGTPSLWGSNGIDFLISCLKKRGITISSDCEFTVELNPGGWNKSDLIKLRESGVNRVSVGVQSLSKQTLKALDRIHTLDDVYRALDALAEIGFNFSVDFMLGLPKEKTGKRNILNEVSKILTFNPSHLSSYILTVNKNYIHYSDLPDENIISEEYLEFSTYMQENGFEHYEISNFSKPGARSRHNMKYWNGESVAAIGPSATGFVRKGVASGVRYKWKTIDTPKYSVEEISEYDFKLERFFLSLRTSDGTNLLDFINAKNIREVESFIRQIDKHGHLSSAKIDNIILSPSGFLCADSITARLISYL